MAAREVSLKELEQHAQAIQSMIDAARKMDSPTIPFAEVRKRAMAMYGMCAPDDLESGDSDPDTLIRKADTRQASGDAALVRRGAAAAKRLNAARAVAGSSAAAAIFPTLGHPIERRTLAEDMRVAEVDQIQRRVMAGDSISEIWPQFRSEIV